MTARDVMTSPIYQERDEKNLQSDIAISRVEQVKNTALHMVKITSEKYRWMHVFFSFQLSKDSRFRASQLE